MMRPDSGVLDAHVVAGGAAHGERSALVEVSAQDGGEVGGRRALEPLVRFGAIPGVGRKQRVGLRRTHAGPLARPLARGGFLARDPGQEAREQQHRQRDGSAPTADLITNGHPWLLRDMVIGWCGWQRKLACFARNTRARRRGGHPTPGSSGLQTAAAYQPALPSEETR